MAMRAHQTWEEIFDALGIEAGDLVFLHAGTDRVGGGVSEADELIQALLGRLGSAGTLLVPTYPWRGNPPEGAVMDVRQTPSAAGVLSETFRHLPGTYRSEHYWIPIAGRGRQALELLAGQATVLHPCGPGSALRRLLDAGTKLVGIGVSLNTSSFTLLADYDLEAAYPRRVFSETPIRGQLIDHAGQPIETATFVFDPAMEHAYVATCRPSRLFQLSPALHRSLCLCNEGNLIRFSYPVQLFHEEALRLGRASLAQNTLPPWFGDPRIFDSAGDPAGFAAEE